MAKNSSLRMCDHDHKLFMQMTNSNGMHTQYQLLKNTVQCKILTGENIDEFDEFLAIRQYFSYQIFHLVSYLPLMNLW